MTLPSFDTIIFRVIDGLGSPAGLATTVKMPIFSAGRKRRLPLTAYFVATKVKGSNGVCFSSSFTRLVSSTVEARGADFSGTVTRTRRLASIVVPSGVQRDKLPYYFPSRSVTER